MSKNVDRYIFIIHYEHKFVNSFIKIEQFLLKYTVFTKAIFHLKENIFTNFSFDKQDKI